jgi:hypothetical protein
MENPWASLGFKYIHPDDEYLYRQHNAKAKKAHQIERGLPPLPYVGDPRTARAILLAKNANYDEQDEEEAIARPALFTENEKSLTFESAYPFFYLDPQFAGTTGYTWWAQVLGPLVATTLQAAPPGTSGQDILARIACLQSHPYRSRESIDLKEPFPTQAWTCHLAREAAARPGVVFVMMGNASRWLLDVPALGRGAKVVRLNNVRKPYVTPGNMSVEDFDSLVRVLAAP